MLRDFVAKGEVMRERMRRPGDDDEAASERSATEGMLLRTRPRAHAQHSAVDDSDEKGQER